MVAIVSGGSRGIGLSIVKQLLDSGMSVVATSRAETEEIKKLSVEYFGKLEFISADISKKEDRERIVASALSRFGQIDLLVNNAGVAPKNRKDILEISEDDFDYVMDINLKGTYFLSQLAATEMIKTRSGRIINISSMSSYTASVNRGEYCISKAGISMITKLFAARLAEDNIFVFEVLPGIIDTDMTDKVKEKHKKLIDEGITPIRRMGQPEDVANVVTALASGKFDFATGTAINCDGGFHIRRL